MKITVLGRYGYGSVGEEAYRLAFRQLLPQHNFTFTDCLHNPEQTIILGGGNVLIPYFTNQLHKFPASDKYAMSLTVSGNPDLSIFKKVISRNKHPQAICLPDFTFILQADSASGRKLLDQLFTTYKTEKQEKVVAIVLNNELTTDANFDTLCSKIASVMDDTEANFILLPFGNGFPINDRIANSHLYAKCKNWRKNLIVFESLSVIDTLNICASVDSIISTRLHSSIFACIGGVSFIDLGYHEKTNMFLGSIGRTAWGLDYQNFEINSLKTLLVDHLANGKKSKTELQAISKNNRRTLLDAVVV